MQRSAQAADTAPRFTTFYENPKIKNNGAKTVKNPMRKELGEKKLPLTAIREKEDQTSPPFQPDDVLGLIKSITHSPNINELRRQCYDSQ